MLWRAQSSPDFVQSIAAGTSQGTHPNDRLRPRERRTKRKSFTTYFGKTRKGRRQSRKPALQQFP